jgi:hypothetical protein
MTGINMVYNFQQLLETISDTFHAKERLDTHEILSYLNRTINRYIKTKYFSGASFKENTYRLATAIGDLRSLIKITPTGTTPVFTAVLGYDSNVHTTTLPTDYYGYISSMSKATRITVEPTFSDKWIPNKEIDYSEIQQVVTTEFNKPILEAPLIVLKDDGSQAAGTGVIDGLMIVTDAYTTVSDILFTYVKTPTAVEMSATSFCELADYLHEEIVQLAVAMYVDEYKTRLAREQKVN